MLFHSIEEHDFEIYDMLAFLESNKSSAPSTRSKTSPQMCEKRHRSIRSSEVLRVRRCSVKKHAYRARSFGFKAGRFVFLCSHSVTCPVHMASLVHFRKQQGHHSLPLVCRSVGKN